jgi:hypothetical protein
LDGAADPEQQASVTVTITGQWAAQGMLVNMA